MTYRVITGILTARTAVHIGSGEGNDLTDALIRRDTQGRPFIPGTAIAGALRSLLTRLAPRLGFELCVVLADDEKARKKSCQCAVCHLFGDVNPSNEENSQSASSRVLVFNATPVYGLPRLLIRDGVGIDRITGTAARAGSVKFDLEVLSAGSEFELRIELWDADEQDEQLLAAGLAEWQARRLWLGGRVARGLGAFDVENLEFKTLALETPDQVLAYLKSDEPWKEAQPQKDWVAKQINTLTTTAKHRDIPAVLQGWVLIEGTLQAEGPLLTNDVLVSGQSGFDHAPLLAQVGDWQRPVLTGAGLRGVIRAHAERIARTLATYNANGKDDFLLKCPACSPVESRPDAPLASCDTLLKKAKVSSETIVSDDQLCLACRLFGSTRRGSRLIAEDAPFAGEKPVLKMLDFLAIDRFTGGGAEGAKFDALALWKPTFTLRLHLENPEPWELGWLWLVLRDLNDGWLQVGFGAAKGFGRVRLKDWTARIGYLVPEDVPGVTELGLGERKSGVYTTVQWVQSTAGWQELVNRWINEFHKAVSDFSRPELRLNTDCYFGSVDSLYPVLKGGAQ